MYNNLSDYYKKKYSVRVEKICIDGGFTCPNRDGTKGFGGCIFCNESGSGEQILGRSLSIKEQIERQVSKAKDGKFIAYYQNFSNTYAPINVLKERFLPSIECDSVVGLSIGTRPDCVDENVSILLKKLSTKKDITVELGLQTANDNTAKVINRCYKSQEFTRCVSLLNDYNIDVVVHIILGLPGESFDDVKQTVDFLNKHKYSGIKIHSQYVVKDTVLSEKLLHGEYTPIDFDEYVNQAVYVLTHINPSVIVHRITGDGDRKTLLAPLWGTNKLKVINAITARLR